MPLDFFRVSFMCLRARDSFFIFSLGQIGSQLKKIHWHSDPDGSYGLVKRVSWISALRICLRSTKMFSIKIFSLFCVWKGVKVNKSLQVFINNKWKLYCHSFIHADEIFSIMTGNSDRFTIQLLYIALV